MSRITKSDLERLVQVINMETGSPLEPYTRNQDGKLVANIGNYHLSGAYGGWSLHRMVTDTGGVESTLNCGHIPKRALFERMAAFRERIRAGKGVTQ